MDWKNLIYEIIKRVLWTIQHCIITILVKSVRNVTTEVEFKKPVITFSNPAKLQLKRFVFHLIMNDIDTE